MPMREASHISMEPGNMTDTKDDESRPWHGAGAASPFEALYQHFTAEIAALRGHGAAPAAVAPKVDTVEAARVADARRLNMPPDSTRAQINAEDAIRDALPKPAV